MDPESFLSFKIETSRRFSEIGFVPTRPYPFRQPTTKFSPETGQKEPVCSLDLGFLFDLVDSIQSMLQMYGKH